MRKTAVSFADCLRKEASKLVGKKFSGLFENKLFCLIFSVFLSILLWAYVEYVQNPDVNVMIYGIPITYTGDEKLAENNLVVTDKDTASLNVRFVGKRNALMHLSSKNLSAEVSYDDIIRNGGTTGIYQLSYKIIYPDSSSENSLTVSDASKDFVTITVEKLIRKSVNVRATFDGNIADGYRGTNPVVDTAEIDVSGPQAIVSNVSYAEAVITGTDVNRTLQQETNLILKDIDGNLVDMDQLTLSKEDALVTVDVQMLKDVSLVVNLKEGVSATENNTAVTCEPAYITLAGDPEILEELNQITLGTIDLTAFAVTNSESFVITVPNGTENLTGTITATVSVEVMGQSIRRLSADNIQVKEETEGYETTVITQSLDVLLRGSESSLNKITAENIRIVADLSTLGNTTGTYSAPAKVVVDGYTDVDPIGSYKVTVTLTQIEP